MGKDASMLLVLQLIINIREEDSKCLGINPSTIHNGGMSYLSLGGQGYA